MLDSAKAPGGAFRITLWVLLCAVAIALGTIISGVILTVTMLTPPKISLSPGEGIAGVLVGALVVAAGVMLLAPYIHGSRIRRLLLLFLFIYLAHGVNTVIEASIFTTIGGGSYLLVMNLLPSMLCAFVATLPAPETEGDARGVRPPLPWPENITVRLLIAWLAFPLIYLLFGTIISPLVIDYYRAPGGMFIIPAFSTMLLVQLARSALYLLPVFLLIFSWSSSRRHLFWSMGLAMFFLVGLSGLITPGMLPARLRLVHSIEILADSMVYVGVLAGLLAPRGGVIRQSTPVPVPVLKPAA